MEDIFDRQRKCLRIVGNEALNQSSEIWRKPVKMLFASYVLLAQWPMINYCVYNRHDILLITEAISTMCTALLSVVRMSSFFFNENKFYNTMNKFSVMFEQMRDPEANHILTTENTLSKRLNKLYFNTSLAAGLYFMLTPVATFIWMVVMQKDITHLELPFPMAFPFDFQPAPVYLPLYIYCGTMLYVGIIYSLLVDCTYFTFVYNLRGHFKSLQRFIERRSFLKDDDHDDDEGEARLRKEIGNYVRYHQMLLQLSEEVCQIYKPIICGQLLLTSVEVGVILYRLVSLNSDVANLLTYGTFLCAILLQLFIYCYGGEIVTNESFNVGIAVQLSNWYNLSPSNRRMLLLMLIRSQRPVTMKAFIYDASLENFMAILKAAVSYITLIQSVE